MTEKFEFTYQQLLDKSIEYAKKYYKNIDALDSAINISNQTFFSTQKSQTYTPAYGDRSGWGTSSSKTVVFTHQMKMTKVPAVVATSTLTTYLTGLIKKYCTCENLSDTVSAKGLLAFINMITWVLKNGTYVVQPSRSSTATGYPCFVTPTATYDGVEKGENDVIKADDFKHINNTLQTITSVAQAYPDSVTHSYWISAGNSCSSCSSSSSSSSCSSSCSSSSSSSCSSAFIQYLVLSR